MIPENTLQFFAAYEALCRKHGLFIGLSPGTSIKKIEDGAERFQKTLDWLTISLGQKKRKKTRRFLREDL